MGHNAFLRWSALQHQSFIDPADNKRKIWSESHVSEDFVMVRFDSEWGSRTRNPHARSCGRLRTSSQRATSPGPSALFSSRRVTQLISQLGSVHEPRIPRGRLPIMCRRVSLATRTRSPTRQKYLKACTTGSTVGRSTPGDAPRWFSIRSATGSPDHRSPRCTGRSFAARHRWRSSCRARPTFQATG